MEINIRQPSVAGMFYPAQKEELEQMLEGFFAHVPKTADSRIPKALIVPHAGYIYSGQVAAYGYARIRGYKKAIVLGPSHHVYLDDAVTDSHGAWETPLGLVKVMRHIEFKCDSQAHRDEHCLEVQIPFLQYILKEFEMLPLVVGQADIVSVSKKIQKLLQNDTLLIISSDFSHYYDYATAVKLDAATIKAVESLNADDITEACGETPIRVLIRIAKACGWQAEVLECKNSGDVTKDKSQVVGYASIAFYA